MIGSLCLFICVFLIFFKGDSLKNKLIKHWPIFALILIFLFSFHIRSINIQPDMIVHFDPVFQLRMTQYIVDWGHLPIWDELTYYVGGAKTPTDSPFMWYLTAWFFMILKTLGSTMSLMTTAVYASALYGALAVLPAYFLVKEFSNKYGGLLAATLIATAPQILIRTFGGSFDTDQMVIFFILMSLLALITLIKRKNIATMGLALLVFTAFIMTWPMFVYTIAIIGAFVVAYFLISWFLKRKDENSENLKKKHIKELTDNVVILTAFSFILMVIGFILKKNLIENFLAVFGFALKPESLIVNISIAELQPFNIFNFAGWVTALGNFTVGDVVIDSGIMVVFMALMLTALYISYKKKNIFDLAFIMTLIGIGIYTTFRGIRFTEFSSILFLCVAGIGYGKLIDFIKDRNITVRNFVFGLGIAVIFIGMFIGSSVGEQVGPEKPPNWMDAWDFIRTQTPELSVVGTWWDPGHMIAGFAERRNMADGAHCGSDVCLYGINDRITSLGKIMATNDEEESIELINKYKGNSPKAYWIASNDLIGKFQWCQYFGTGCDARVDPNCQLYLYMGLTNQIFSGNDLFANQYGSVLVMDNYDFPLPLLVQNRIAMMPKEIIYYENNEVKILTITEGMKTALIESMKPHEEALAIRMSEDLFEYTVWVEETGSYIVLIPPRMRDAVFTKMFMLEGEGLDHFKQVFRNNEVKIYEVIF